MTARLGPHHLSLEGRQVRLVHRHLRRRATPRRRGPRSSSSAIPSSRRGLELRAEFCRPDGLRRRQAEARRSGTSACRPTARSSTGGRSRRRPRRSAASRPRSTSSSTSPTSTTSANVYREEPDGNGALQVEARALAPSNWARAHPDLQSGWSRHFTHVRRLTLRRPMSAPTFTGPTASAATGALLAVRPRSCWRAWGKRGLELADANLDKAGRALPQNRQCRRDPGRSIH